MGKWLETIQSIGRGFRKEEITIMKGRNQGKSYIVDPKNFEFMDWSDHVLCAHYVQTRDLSNDGELTWFKYKNKPNLSTIFYANTVIRHNNDGSYEYIKNRQGPNRVLDHTDEQELIWIILQAQDVNK